MITEAWLHDAELKEQVEGYMYQIFEYMLNAGLYFRVREEAPNQSDGASKSTASSFYEEEQTGYQYFQATAPVVLVLEVRLSGSVGYYFVDHPRRRLFWLDEMDFSFEVGEVRIEHNNSTIGLEMQSHYWKHNDYFPHLYELTLKDLVEIDDMIAFALGGKQPSWTCSLQH